MSSISETETSSRELQACHCCGLIQYLPVLSEDEVAECTRCGSHFHRRSEHDHASSRTAAAALAAFVLFWPAVLLPILQIEQLGMKSTSSVIGGIIDLYRHGNFFVGSVVFFFSIVFPLTKIVLLFELSFLELLHQKHKAYTLRLMENLGKWSMMDVLLLAFFVMLVKLGDMVEFHFGPAIVAFVLCVGMSMVASLSFDPHTIWDERQV
ncbi:MAG: paraquat-inducible protein A [Planctomycetota bacterium]